MRYNFYKIAMKIGRLLCHQKHERCFFFRGYQFPICARCFGITIGFFITLISLYMKYYICLLISIFFLSIMFIDWFIQFLNIKQSNNIRRLITGIFGGLGVSYLYYYIIQFFIILIQ